jgi:hypothetical protein
MAPMDITTHASLPHDGPRSRIRIRELRNG